MPFLPFPEYRPDVSDWRGSVTSVLSNVLPRGDGWGPFPNLQGFTSPLAEGNDTYTKVLLHFDGSDTSTTITDSNAGGSAHTWTANGNAQIDTAIYKLGGASLLCDGTGDYVTTPDHADFALGSGDFTIDVWFKCEAAGGSAQRIAGQCDSGGTDASFTIYRNSSNFIEAVVYGGSTVTLTGTTQFTSAANTGWHHAAIVRNGAVLTLYIDGVSEDSDAITGSVANSASALSVGRLGEVTTSTWTGSIDEFRISVGVARWTSAFSSPKSPYDTAANGICRGFTYGRATDGTIAVFAATSTRLHKLDNSTLQWEDVSKNGVAYSGVSSTDQWQFAQYGSVIIAVQANSAPQAFTLLSSSAFADLAGSPPTSRYVAVVGRFLVMCGIVSTPLRVQWSGLDAITTWTAGTSFSNYVDLPDGGVVRGVAGGEFGVILQESTSRSMVYVPGASTAFQIERIAEELGLLGPYSIVRAGGRVLFVSPQGFQQYAPGQGLLPIGKEKVDRTFLADLDKGYLNLLIGASDPTGTRAFWGYKSLASPTTTSFDKIICYDIILQKWSPSISVSGQYLGPLVKPGLTLEALDDISLSIDALSFSLDSVQAALGSKLAAFTTSNVLGFFDGDNLEATLETPEQQADNGRRIMVRGLAPRTDAATVYGSVRHRANAQANYAQTSETLINSEGRCPQRIDTRCARGSIRIPASTSWTYASGVEPDFVETGTR